MEVQLDNPSVQQFGLVFVATVAWALFVGVFYMVVAWRAMRAHERIAATLERFNIRLKSEAGGGDAPSA